MAYIVFSLSYSKKSEKSREGAILLSVTVRKGNGTLSWWCMFEQWLIEKDRRRLENLWITFFIADVEKACLSLTINHVGVQHWRTPSHEKKGREQVQLDKEAKINVKWFFFERSPKSSLYSFYSGSVSSTLNPNDDDGEHFPLLSYFFASLLVFEDMMNQPIQFCFRKRAQAPCGYPFTKTLNSEHHLLPFLHV